MRKMRKMLKRSVLVAAAALGAGCATLQPELPAADPAIEAEWPLPTTTDESVPDAAAEIGWRSFFADPDLEALIAQALENNRDLRVAVLNVERARAQYRIQRSERLPSVGAGGEMVRGRGLTNGAATDPGVTEAYAVSLGIAEFELDLFGRVRNLSDAALAAYFAQEAARRSAQLTLVAEIASAYLTLMADQELQRVAQAALANRQQALDLTRQRHRLGATTALEVSQAETTVETARTDVARYAGRVAQGRNALALLIGAPIEPARLPSTFDLRVSGLDPLPAGLPSAVLLRRPDVLLAEHRLRGANADIGAARAAFFPSVRLTGSVGTGSDELSGLFHDGTRQWRFMPRVDLPIFQGGRLRANLGAARAGRDIALAEYERAIQVGFSEVADALALTRSLSEQIASQRALVAAAARAEALSRARYEGGRDSFLVLLDAQRTLYAAEQSLVAVELAEQTNRVTLYKVLGGGWQEQ